MDVDLAVRAQQHRDNSALPVPSRGEQRGLAHVVLVVDLLFQTKKTTYDLAVPITCPISEGGFPLLVVEVHVDLVTAAPEQVVDEYHLDVVSRVFPEAQNSLDRALFLSHVVQPSPCNLNLLQALPPLEEVATKFLVLLHFLENFVAFSKDTQRLKRLQGVDFLPVHGNKRSPLLVVEGAGLLPLAVVLLSPTQELLLVYPKTASDQHERRAPEVVALVDGRVFAHEDFHRARVPGKSRDVDRAPAVRRLVEGLGARLQHQLHGHRVAFFSADVERRFAGLVQHLDVDARVPQHRGAFVVRVLARRVVQRVLLAVLPVSRLLDALAPLIELLLLIFLGFITRHRCQVRHQSLSLPRRY